MRLIDGDALNILPTLPSESVNCVVTSPPYWGLRDYGVDGQLGLEPTPEEYVTKMVAVFREVWRVLRDDGTLWLNLGDSYASGPGGPVGATSQAAPKHRDARMRGPIPDSLKPKDLVGIPWRVAFALQADGWYLRSDIIWSKTNPMPESVKDRPTKAHEYLFLMTKQARYWYDADAIAQAQSPVTSGNWSKGHHDANLTSGTYRREYTPPVNGTRNRRTVWHIATQPFPEAHFATYPEKLVEPCVLAGCPSQVCAACGAPWVRVVDRTAAVAAAPRGVGGTETARGIHGQADRPLHGGRDWYENANSSITTGWQPTCTCAADTIPGTVLDPFTGSGTTGAVACRLGRDFVGIELNPDYVEMARRRIAPHANQLTLEVPT